MPRRHLRVISSSSDEEFFDAGDDLVSLPPPPPSHQISPHIQPEEEEEEEEDQIINDEVGIGLQQSTINLQTVTLSSSNSNSINPTLHSRHIPEPIPFNISDDDSYADDPMDGGIHHNPSPNTINPNIGTDFVNNPNCDGINGILRRMGLVLKREWLDACIGALESSVQGFSGLDDLAKAKLCFEQFLNADMNYCGAGVLPRDVHSLHLVDLKGPFILQVDEIVNISAPLRDRYQKAAPGVKRCLKLSMTDGVQRVFSMEYRPIKDFEVLSPAGMKVAICNVNVRRGILMLVPEVIEVLGGKVEELDAALHRLVHEINKPARGKRTRTGVVPPLATRATRAAWPVETINRQEQINNTRTATVAVQVDEPGTASGIPASDRTEEYRRENDEAILSSAADIDEVHIVAELEHVGRMIREEGAPPIHREEVGPNLFSSVAMDVEESRMVDELNHPFIFTGGKQSPYTYLASLSAEWAAMKGNVSKVQGKIKCFLTGVKGFQYKKRITYELRVYVDDGSLISEILIDHNVVQNGIGYSPEEVGTALASSDARRVSEMKETLKQFQVFLVNFEGTMLVEMSEEASSVPVAIEMNQGCPSSDAWLLLKRLSSANSAQHQHNSRLNAIDLSP